MNGSKCKKDTVERKSQPIRLREMRIRLPLAYASWVIKRMKEDSRWEEFITFQQVRQYCQRKY